MGETIPVDIQVGLRPGSAVLTQPLFQVMLSSLACLPGPHVTDIPMADIVELMLEVGDSGLKEFGLGV